MEGYLSDTHRGGRIRHSDSWRGNHGDANSSVWGTGTSPLSTVGTFPHGFSITCRELESYCSGKQTQDVARKTDSAGDRQRWQERPSEFRSEPGPSQGSGGAGDESYAHCQRTTDGAEAAMPLMGRNLAV